MSLIFPETRKFPGKQKLSHFPGNFLISGEIEEEITREREGHVDHAFVAEMFESTGTYEEFVQDYLVSRVLADELRYLE